MLLLEDQKENSAHHQPQKFQEKVILFTSGGKYKLTLGFWKVFCRFVTDLTFFPLTYEFPLLKIHPWKNQHEYI